MYKNSVQKIDKKDLYIYDVYIKNPNFFKDLKQFSKKLLWMNKCTILLTNNKVEHNCKEIACNVSFSNKNGWFHHLITDYNNIYNGNIHNSGVFIHTDCYKYIEKKYHIKLKYNNIPLKDCYLPLKDCGNNKMKTIDFINYGEIEKYYGQYFKFIEVFLDNKQYLCSSPLKNDKNLVQINKNFHNMKISQKYLLRPSPPISATFYSTGDIKVGNNGNLWIIKNNKWSEIKQNVCRVNITINKNKFYNLTKYFNKISFISQFNNVGIFVEDIIETKSVFKFTLLTTIDKKDDIEKKFR